MRENPGCTVTKYQFSQLFSKAWYKAIQPNNLISGFAKTGIHPLNFDTISVPTLPDMEVDLEHEEEVAAGEDDRGDLEEMEEGAPEDNQGVTAFLLQSLNGLPLDTRTDTTSTPIQST